MPSRAVKLVRTDASQARAAIQQELCRSLRTRQISSQFLYHSPEQAQKWLKLHETYSPARLDRDCIDKYEEGFRAALEKLPAGPIHVFGFSSGGALKERTLLEILFSAGHRVAFSPMDVSMPLVLEAKQAVVGYVPAELCFPSVMDLGRAEGIRDFIESILAPHHHLLFTFFGTLHNFEPETILPKLRDALRGSELLLLSANMLPAAAYNERIREILTAYNNQLTRDWLLAFLPTVGLREDQGELKFTIQSSQRLPDLKRIIAKFEFSTAASTRVAEERFDFVPGDSLRLFFSYRFTPAVLARLLQQHGFRIMGQWISSSEEEGIFLVSCTESSCR